jgi:hypothetical protein
MLRRNVLHQNSRNSYVRLCETLNISHCQSNPSIYEGPKIRNTQYRKTNVMHFLFNLLRIKGLYMFRALLAHPQEANHKRQLVHCVCVMSVGCTKDRCSPIIRTVNKTLSLSENHSFFCPYAASISCIFECLLQVAMNTKNILPV